VWGGGLRAEALPNFAAAGACGRVEEGAHGASMCCLLWILDVFGGLHACTSSER
jgi:hypothetical protein